MEPQTDVQEIHKRRPSITTRRTYRVVINNEQHQNDSDVDILELHANEQDLDQLWKAFSIILYLFILNYILIPH